MQLFEVSPERYALFFGLNALGLITMGQVSARLVRRVPAERALGATLGVMAVAGLLLLAAVSGALVGALRDGTALPMAAVIASCGVLGALLRKVLLG